MPVKKQHLESNMEQRTGSRFRKVVYHHSAYLIDMQSISCEVLCWRNQVGIKISGRIINLRYTDDTALMAESEDKLESLEKGERGE